MLLSPLYSLLLKCWRECTVPQEMRDSNIITLYKNKGDRGDCNNYRGIYLLSVVGNIFARIILTRLQTLAERVYPDSQSGFCSGRVTVDMICCVRQLQEKAREQQMPLHVAFVDLTKQGSNRCHSMWHSWISLNKGTTEATPRGICGSHKTREQQMPLHMAFVDLTKQGSNRCHSTWHLWISLNKGATDATPRGICGSH